MPLYEYLCHSCGKTIEVIQKFSDAPLTVHEACGGELEKLISRSAIQFKGSGWYVTDYGKGGVLPKGAEGASGETKAAESKGSSETKSSEGKPSETKSTESKPAESKTAEAKPAAPKPAAPTATV